MYLSSCCPFLVLDINTVTEISMTEGTKSYLIGCHQFFFHPLWVLLTWRLEYKSWPKWWEIICVFLRDVGICGKQYLSNDEAKIGHWEKGAKLASKIVGTVRDETKYRIWNSKEYPWEKPLWMQAYELCAGHCPEESGFSESKLSRADKRSWLVAPMWWLWCNYWIERFVTNPRLWKKLVAENLRSKSPIGNHELYLRHKR